MYAWIWRRLPGQGAVKVLVAVGLVIGFVAVLWYFVFPWAESKIQFDRNTVEREGSSVVHRPSPR